MANANEIWKLPPSDLSLPKDFVHIWRVYLDSDLLPLESLRNHLSPDEVIRANRFYFKRDHDRFIVCRGILRVILGRYLSIGPSQICFRYGTFGKPTLDIDTQEGTLCFNLSHSNGLAVYAVTWDNSIGIDVEYNRPITEVQDIAKRFFTSKESKILRSLSEEKKSEMFFRYWTRKEAYIKACGEGLSRPLNQLDVSHYLKAIPKPIEVEEQRISRWSLMDIFPDPDYIAAFVVDRKSFHVNFWEEPSKYNNA